MRTASLEDGAPKAKERPREEVPPVKRLVGGASAVEVGVQDGWVSVHDAIREPRVARHGAACRAILVLGLPC